MTRRDPYYKTPDGYDAYQWRELIKREIKNGKVYSTYKCSNLGGEVDIFTTEFPEQKPTTTDEFLDALDGIEDACDLLLIMVAVFMIICFFYKLVY